MPADAAPSPTRVTMGIPDLISPSYFPAIAGARLGLADGVEIEIVPSFPVSEASRALAAGELDFLAGAAHAALYGFPRWDGVTFVSALSRHTYWFLVVRSDLGVARGDLDRLRGLRIAAAPGVDVALKVMLEDAGVAWGDGDDEVKVVPVPSVGPGTISFGVAAADALRAGLVDGFWANGMGAHIAERDGIGTVVVDARRGDGPAPTRGYTFAAVLTSTATSVERPDIVAAVQQAIGRAHDALRAEPDLAAEAAAGLFPDLEASLIATLIRRDAPFYDASITLEAMSALEAFAVRAGLLDSPVGTLSAIVSPAIHRSSHAEA